MNYSALLCPSGLNGVVLPLLSLGNLGAVPTIQNSAIISHLKPIYNQSGPVFEGPGSLQSHQEFSLCKLELEQRATVDRAKRYAMEESFKAALAKQALQHPQLQQQQQPLAFNRAHTLTLLSRIYVGSISYDLKEDSLRQAFSPFGPIKSITLSWDAGTQKHKGFAFLEFELPESALLAVNQMNGASLGGRQLKVGRPSNLPDASPLIDKLVNEHNLQRKVYVSGVHSDLCDADLSLVFEPFGKINSCKLHTDGSSNIKHHNFGYIEYDTEQSANDAVANMNMFDLGGQYLRVCKAISPPENLPSVTPLVGDDKLKQRSPDSTESHSNLPVSLSWDQVEALESGRSELQTKFPADSDDADNDTLEHQENFHIRGSNARNLLMQKLIRPPPRGVLILRNMVGPDDCDDELESEINDECSNYGTVDRVIIYQELEESGELIIKIFVVFTESDAVDRALAVLNGRYFAGRQITAERYALEKFESNDLTG